MKTHQQFFYTNSVSSVHIPHWSGDEIPHPGLYIARAAKAMAGPVVSLKSLLKNKLTGYVCGVDNTILVIKGTQA